MARPIPAHPTGSWAANFVALLTLITAAPVMLNITWPDAVDARLVVAMAMLSHLLLAACACVLPAWVLARHVSTHRGAIATTLAIPGTVWLLLVCIDARVFHLYGFHLDGLVLGLLADGALLGQLGITASGWVVVLSVVALVLLSLWLAAFRLLAQSASDIPQPRRSWLWVLPPMLIATQAMAIWHDARGRIDVMGSLQPIPWLRTATARSSLAHWGLAQEMPRNAVDAAVRASAAHGTPQPHLQCAAEHPMNVLMIVVDSLRHDMLTASQMPHTWKLAEQSWVARQHYSTGNNTMHGVFGLFHGLPALQANTMISHRHGPELLRQLSTLGYSHHLYGAASLRGARLDRSVFVDTDAPLHQPPDSIPADQRDRWAVDALAQALRSRKAGPPFFGFVLLDGAHAPYAVPDDATLLHLPQASAGAHLMVGRSSDPRPLFNRYRNAVLHVDTLIGQMLSMIEDAGLASNTVIIVTSDHGESFNDLAQNDWGHNGNFSDMQTRVPMIIRWPGRASAVESAVTSHMDIAPTLLRNLAGCTTSVEAYSAGLDLFGPLPAARPLLVESWTSRAIRYGGQTVLMHPYGIEVRDRQYRPIADDHVAQAVGQQVFEQMQLIRPGERRGASVSRQATHSRGVHGNL